jgi:DNA-directed RNA polymerase specialized sigma24 family protein
MAKLAIRMDEVHEFCRRVLGSGEDADDAAREALAGPPRGRVEVLAAAARACRARAGNEPRTGEGEAPVGLAASVTAEVELATSKLPERHREALALRESLRLSHDQIAGAIGVDVAAVAMLLARARLRLREERRQAAAELTQCPDRERSLRALARRQDSEPLTGDDDEWLLAHLRDCVECDQAHAAMIEASVCYRAASPPERVQGGTPESIERERAVAAHAEAG